MLQVELEEYLKQAQIDAENLRQLALLNEKRECQLKMSLFRSGLD